MSGVMQLLSDIGEFFTTVFDIVVKLVQDIIYIVSLITELVTTLPDYFGWLPAECVVLLIALFAIVVIYKVLGRD